MIGIIVITCILLCMFFLLGRTHDSSHNHASPDMKVPSKEQTPLRQQLSAEGTPQKKSFSAGYNVGYILATLKENPPHYKLGEVTHLLEQRLPHFKTPSYGVDYPDPYGDKIFKAVYAAYTEGQKLEKQKDFHRALDYYIVILLTTVPLGDVYYQRPAILLERLKYYEAALAICKLRYVHIEKDAGQSNSLKEEWKKRELRLRDKQSKSLRTEK